MSGKDWPNLQRMFAALMFLLISPLIGIVVGAIYWDSLERGLLVFNLLGLAGFALLTRPFWQRDSKRTQSLLSSAGAVVISALLDIVTGKPVAFSVYFSAMWECFHLIPWITGILREIHQGQWSQSIPRSAAPPEPVRRKIPPPRPEPAQEGPELPLPGFPWWGYGVLVLLLGVGGLLLLR